MTHAHYKIMFDGELMPEMPLDTVKDNLARLFKTDRRQIDNLFGRGPVALKRALPEEQAERYLQALRQAGAAARKEPDLSASLSLEPIVEESAAASETQPANMVCPKCGHRQPRTAECSSCGIIIEKYLARQAELAALPERKADAGSPYAPPLSQVAGNPDEYSTLKVFSVAGRIGRLRYLAWSGVLLAAASGLFLLAALLMFLSSTLGIFLMVVIGIAMAVVSVQIGAQRLHDIGWTGWLLLVNLIPVLGTLFALVMLALPGNKEANRFGPPPPPNTRAVKALAVLGLILGAILGVSTVLSPPSLPGVG
ncbi:DUF805 domain-containing protein [Stutzerimonas azotifigens]|uniref:DUF805 domain-containing protein n=1 Tax=Stutzerimonas azotifigens TaxID=291995 RepID=UPI0004071C7E|nr:DUF805 domain-containing protein [Stutzerimonas azotifigens]